MSRKVNKLDKVIGISGFSGFIGSNFLNTLSIKKYKKIYLITRGPINSPKLFKNCEVIKVGENYKNIKNFKKKLKTIDIFYHFAYQNNVSASIKRINYDLYNNLTPIKKILNSLLSNTLFIFTSSASVYGDSPKKIFTEVDKINALSNYDFNKIYCENFIQNYCKKFNINYLIYRLSNIYGFQKKNIFTKRGFLFSFIKKISLSKNIELNTNGKCLRDYLYINDCVNGLTKAITLKKNYLNKTYNMLYGKSYSLRDIFLYTKKVLIKDFKIKSSSQLFYKRNLNLPLTDLRSFRGSSQLYKSISKWKPTTNLKSGIKNIINEIIL
jgi:UDP-glucose 4-epimerase